ncbi:MAG TPA: HAD family phosphatase [Candidatus Margulisiibacteriota bacterium]|nr:HAD family phosphatase [Candidatus Margulisiibacteriota bacterium]
MAHAAVIFDLDGVLIDSEALHYKAYSEVLARFGISVSLEEYAVHWIAAGQGPEYAVRTHGLHMHPDELRALKQPVYHDILRREVALMPGTVAALTRLQPHFALALATNSNRQDVSVVTERFDLQRFFTAMVTREDYRNAKPHPDAFLTAATRLGMTPAACLVVEDAERGVLAAHRAGTAVVAIPNRFTCDSDLSLATVVLPSLDALSVDLVTQLVADHQKRVRLGSPQ